MGFFKCRLGFSSHFQRLLTKMLLHCNNATVHVLFVFKVKFAIHFKTICVMEFSREKRIFNLVSSSTSGNSVKKAKKEIQNAELLLNYCCNKPSTTSDSNLINEIKSYNHDTPG